MAWQQGDFACRLAIHANHFSAMAAWGYLDHPEGEYAIVFAQNLGLHPPFHQREFVMDEIRAFFQRDAFARHLGIELTEVSAGHAKATMPVRHYHANALGGLHGGAIFGLADFVFSAASNGHGNLSVAINVTISYLRTPEGELLHAEAVEVSRSRRLGSYAVRVTDDHEHLVATFHGMVYVKGDPLPFRAPDEPATHSA